ncbi:hypothetical protein [Mesorhizobium sp. M0129]|uniref:hypothetical protein n=1 Tax=Mesorhizobium sp. M0129 TaxID=2956886 RepID=UPI00333652B1
MPTDNATANRNWQLPNGGNNLGHDVGRLIAALQAADLDVANILSTLVLKAPILNAGLTGAPTAPTPAAADNSNKIATTAWARLYFADIVGAAPAALDTIAELAAALQNDPSVITNLTTLVGNKITGPAVAVADNIATFNGTTGKIAKDSGVAVSSLAPKASPALTGVPTAPTAAPGTNTTQLATTGFVKAAIDVLLGGVSAAFDTLSEIATELGMKASLTYVDNGLATKLSTSAAKLQAFFESAQQSITVAGALTLAHGLGIKPKLYLAYLQCTTAEGGYVVGDEVMPSPNNIDSGSGGTGVTIVPDTTNLTIRYDNNTWVFSIGHKTTGANFRITPANWRMVVRAWA